MLIHAGLTGLWPVKNNAPAMPTQYIITTDEPSITVVSMENDRLLNINLL